MISMVYLLQQKYFVNIKKNRKRNRYYRSSLILALPNTLSVSLRLNAFFRFLFAALVSTMDRKYYIYVLYPIHEYVLKHRVKGYFPKSKG